MLSVVFRHMGTGSGSVSTMKNHTRVNICILGEAGASALHRGPAFKDTSRGGACRPNAWVVGKPEIKSYSYKLYGYSGLRGWVLFVGC